MEENQRPGKISFDINLSPPASYLNEFVVPENLLPFLDEPDDGVCDNCECIACYIEDNNIATTLMEFPLHNYEQLFEQEGLQFCCDSPMIMAEAINIGEPDDNGDVELEIVYLYCQFCSYHFGLDPSG